LFLLSFVSAGTARPTPIHSTPTSASCNCAEDKSVPRTDSSPPRFFLIENGIHKWRLFSVFPSGRAANDMELRLSNEEFVQMMDFIKLTRLEGRIDASYACDGFLGRYEGEVRRKYFNCSSGVNVASIRADGAISGCLSIRSDYNQGNIYTDSFWDVWENRFEKFRNRKWMRTGDCKSCKVWRYCQGNGMHLRDENGELMMCQYQMINEEKV
ncbi:MAG: SPASM domain-containing protein, partial [Bacteroidales bacterium]|nr:SPASM domain-containing protein [Bacteroidales bacterium]